MTPNSRCDGRKIVEAFMSGGWALYLVPDWCEGPNNDYLTAFKNGPVPEVRFGEEEVYLAVPSIPESSNPFHVALAWTAIERNGDPYMNIALEGEKTKKCCLSGIVEFSDEHVLFHLREGKGRRYLFKLEDAQKLIGEGFCPNLREMAAKKESR